MDRLPRLELLSHNEMSTRLEDVRVWDAGTFVRYPAVEGWPERIHLFADSSQELSVHVSSQSEGWDEFSRACSDILVEQRSELTPTEQTFRTLKRNVTSYAEPELGGKPVVTLKGWDKQFKLGGVAAGLEPPRDVPVVAFPNAWFALRTCPVVARSLDDGTWMAEFWGEWRPLADFQQLESSGLELLPVGSHEGRQYHLVVRNLATAVITRGSGGPHVADGGREVEEVNGERFLPYTPEFNARVVEHVERSGWVPVDEHSLTWANPKAFALVGRFRSESADEAGLVVMATRGDQGQRAMFRCSGPAIEQL